MEGTDQIGTDLLLGRGIQLSRYPRCRLAQSDEEFVHAVRGDRIHGEVELKIPLGNLSAKGG